MNQLETLEKSYKNIKDYLEAKVIVQFSSIVKNIYEQVVNDLKF